MPFKNAEDYAKYMREYRQKQKAEQKAEQSRREESARLGQIDMPYDHVWDESFSPASVTRKQTQKALNASQPAKEKVYDSYDRCTKCHEYWSPRTGHASKGCIDICASPCESCQFDRVWDDNVDVNSFPKDSDELRAEMKAIDLRIAQIREEEEKKHAPQAPAGGN